MLKFAAMKVIVSPDSYKECMPASRVAAVMAAAARERWPEAEVVEIPLADGGEGTLDVLTHALHAQIHTASVQDPLGRSVEARFGLCGDTAIIEVAQACGLSLLTATERHPLEAGTQGVGELLLAAYQAGARHFIVALGGSATCDGGEGLLKVPGIDLLKEANFELLCDVDAPFVGARGAARVFAPQKGASPEEVEVLEQRMRRQASWLYAHTGMDVSTLPGAGAAGGLGGALAAYFGARIQQGIDRILDLVSFDSQARGAHLIITGEGKSDAQTLMGKVPHGVLQRVRQLSVAAPVALVSGCIEDRVALEQAGFNPLVEVTPRNQSLMEALQPVMAQQNIGHAIFNDLQLPRRGREAGD